jgi:hypothetical protein
MATMPGVCGASGRSRIRRSLSRKDANITHIECVVIQDRLLAGTVIIQSCAHSSKSKRKSWRDWKVLKHGVVAQIGAEKIVKILPMINFTKSVSTPNIAHGDESSSDDQALLPWDLGWVAMVVLWLSERTRWDNASEYRAKRMVVL